VAREIERRSAEGRRTRVGTMSVSDEETAYTGATGGRLQESRRKIDTPEHTI